MATADIWAQINERKPSPKNKAGKHIRYKLNYRPSQIKKQSPKAQGQLKRREHEKSSVRAKVEHVFGVVKGRLRYQKRDADG